MVEHTLVGAFHPQSRVCMCRSSTHVCSLNAGARVLEQHTRACVKAHTHVCVFQNNAQNGVLLWVSYTHLLVRSTYRVVCACVAAARACVCNSNTDTHTHTHTHTLGYSLARVARGDLQECKHSDQRLQAANRHRPRQSHSQVHKTGLTRRQANDSPDSFSSYTITLASKGHAKSLRQDK